MPPPKIVQAVRKAERLLGDRCARPEIGADCRRACMVGGMEVIGDILTSYQKPEGLGRIRAHNPSRTTLGIIVSPMEDCPSGFEELVVKTPRNEKVKLCRLGPGVRKKHAPPGKPYQKGAHKGALRRKKDYSRGVDVRPIRKRTRG